MKKNRITEMNTDCSNDVKCPDEVDNLTKARWAGTSNPADKEL